ncbi:MAG TPA: STAS domain-containing protein [Gaiellaceae bacterium]|nr:STAS domain-containing protein [Gaiellaceae bacterium]
MSRAASVSWGVGEFRLEQESPVPGAVVISVHGDVDLHSGPELRERLAAAIDGGTTSIVVDLNGATFVDSMALGVLLASLKRLRARNGRLGLVVATPEQRRIFEITLLDRIFPLYASRDEALADASAGGTV